MKKTVCILMTLILFTLTNPATAETVSPGQTAAVEIGIVTDGVYASIGLDYDASALEFVSAGGGTVAPRSGSACFIFGTGITPIGAASASVTFRVREGAASGSYEVKAVRIECYDASLNDCSCSVSGGSITVVRENAASLPAVTVPDKGASADRSDDRAETDPGEGSVTGPLPGLYPFATGNRAGEKEYGEAEVLEWGLARCRVILNGAETVVNTTDLILSGSVPADHRLAEIYAPKQGKASLREEKNTGSRILESCDAGVIVPVLEYGDKFSKISYLGKEGYILNTSLRFYASCEAAGEGVIRNSSGTDAVMRINRDGSSLKLAKLPNGTKVTVIKAYKDWYEIDCMGLHGFVAKKYLEILDRE